MAQVKRNFWTTASLEQRSKHRASVIRSWQRGRTGNYPQSPSWSVRISKLYDLPPEAIRFYWTARSIFGRHNPNWPSKKISARIKWYTALYGHDDEALRAWHKYMAAYHWHQQHMHMHIRWLHLLPEIDRRYREAWPEDFPDEPPA